MIPIRYAAFTLSRARTSAQFASYTTRSNGAAFLNNLDFLAPAPSQPRPAQQTKPNSLQWQQAPQSSNKTSTPPLAVSLADLEDLADLDVKSPPKRANKFASVEAKGSKDNKDSKDDEDKGPSLDRLRRDEEIRSLWIQYITPEGNQGQKRLAHVLKSFDRSQYYLIEVNPSADPPVCKLFSKKDLYKKAKEAKQAKKASAHTTKELQLHWGTDAHDLDHKLSKFRGFLEKGHRLEIQINGRRGRNTSAGERDAVIERVKTEFEPVSKYVRNMEWVTPTSVTMLLQGVPQKVEKTKEV